ncbi:hypothetical protein IAQ61_007727 [Plenodomus lingam]|uniref:uncharacterized protein n=1 Tax=Leptosphaeria maculans TaxID=5022 RepID=UPI0033320636|nr:hypothetical protein IAQ61_007727 [Plenodomus lingam]
MATAVGGTTLYPKISNHISDVIEALQHLKGDLEHEETDDHREPIPITGTVKLHGTHADILIYSNDEIVFQSRNVTRLSALKDNYGFAATMSTKTKALLQLRDMYKTHWLQINPGDFFDENFPVIVAGEWIGEKIEKGVAISQLSRRFVVISVNINGKWQRDQDYGSISLPLHDIYNVARAGFYTATLYPNDTQRTLLEVESMAEEVACTCPFAETFGIKGKGEGIVWKPTSAEYNPNPTLWFKTKGGAFKPKLAQPPKKTWTFDIAGERRDATAYVARVWCSVQRLEQGWDFLRETDRERNMSTLDDYVKWVHEDILTEEKVYIRKHKLERNDLKVEIAKIAKPWYLAKVKGSSV